MIRGLLDTALVSVLACATTVAEAQTSRYDEFYLQGHLNLFNKTFSDAFPDIATIAALWTICGMIIVAAEYQGRGIGRRLMDELLRQASGRTIVLNSTREGYALYQRLGMTEVARHGPGNIKITMRLSRQRRQDRQST